MHLTFESSFNYKKAQEEAQNIVNILRLKGINVVTLKEMLLSPTKTKELKKFIQYKNIIQNQNVLMNTVINSIDLPLYIKGTDLKYIFVNKMLKKILKLAAFKSQVQLFNKI